MTTYNAIPYVPEGTLDPAAGLNVALRVLRVLAHTTVISMALTAPPGSPSDGDAYIVGAGATGAWAGRDEYLAVYVSEGDTWDFFEPGTLAKVVVNLADGSVYYCDPANSPIQWVPTNLVT